MRFGVRVSIVFVNKNDQNSDSLNWKIYQKNSFFLTTISIPLRVSSGGGLLSNQYGLKLFTPNVGTEKFSADLEQAVLTYP